MPLAPLGGGAGATGRTRSPVVVDPLASFLAESINSWKDDSVRNALDRWRVSRARRTARS